MIPGWMLERQWTRTHFERIRTLREFILKDVVGSYDLVKYTDSFNEHPIIVKELSDVTDDEMLWIERRVRE